MSGFVSDSLWPARRVLGQMVISNQALEKPENDANCVVAAIDRPGRHEPRHGWLILERHTRQAVHS
jgi:hypothetical protein